MRIIARTLILVGLFMVTSIQAGVLVTVDHKCAKGEIVEEGDNIVVTIVQGTMRGRMTYPKSRILWHNLHPQLNSYFQAARLALHERNIEVSLILCEHSARLEPEHADNAKKLAEYILEIQSKAQTESRTPLVKEEPKEEPESPWNKKSQAAPPEKAVADKNPAPARDLNDDVIYKIVKQNLLHIDNKRLKKFDDQQLQTVKFYGIYFSASWCPPCRTFTPHLIKAYEEAKASHPGQFEVIMVGKDNDRKSYDKYMLDYKMPWTCLTYTAAQKTELHRYASTGIPHLVILDTEGKVLARGQGEALREIKNQLSK